MSRMMAMLAVFAVGLAAGLSGCGSQRTRVIGPAATPSWLKADAITAAASLGDKRPSVIHYFLGGRDKIVMHGHFKCGSCSRPSNTTPIQKGTVVVIQFDARTHRETDFGIGSFTGPDETST
jgi:hypothetical protein